ncbi:MAG: TrbI/VirB10 family protein [Methyloligellaceae bacterium]
MTEEQTPDFELRAKERRVHRINKSKLILLVQGVSFVLIVLIALSFWRGEPDNVERQSRPVHQSTRTPEGLKQLPRSYEFLADKKQRQHNRLINREAGYQTKSSKSRRSQDREARNSSLFFKVKTDRISDGSGRGRRGSLSSRLTALSSDLNTRLQTLNGRGTYAEKDPNNQAGKIAFLNKHTSSQTLSTHQLQQAASPYMLMAGTILSASLLSGLNSDLPGQVIAQITRPVYDTMTGQHVLIPQGAKIIGRYDSRISHGQSRALVTWHRIILPNGSSVVIDSLPASDVSGYAGLKDRVDHHSWTLIKGIALATVLSVGTELGKRSTESDLVQAIRQSTQGNIQKAGDRIISQKLEIQPTLKVRPGWPLRVIVSKDILMRPYKPTP